MTCNVQGTPLSAAWQYTDPCQCIGGSNKYHIGSRVGWHSGLAWQWGGEQCGVAVRDPQALQPGTLAVASSYLRAVTKGRLVRAREAVLGQRQQSEAARVQQAVMQCGRSSAPRAHGTAWLARTACTRVRRPCAVPGCPSQPSLQPTARPQITQQGVCGGSPVGAPPAAAHKQVPRGGPLCCTYYVIGPDPACILRPA